MVDTVYIVAIAVLSLMSVFFGFYAIRFGIILLRIQDQVEESLDILDEQYDKMNSVLDIPLAVDSPQVREIVDSIRVSRDAVLEVAEVLVSHSSKEEMTKIDKN